MTKEDAHKLLVEITGQIALKRVDHNNVAFALNLLKPEEPKKNKEVKTEEVKTEKVKKK